MIFTSAILAVASLMGSASAQCSPFGSVTPVTPGAWSFPDAIAYTDNILSFKLNYPPSTSATIVPYVNDSRVIAYPKTLTFSSSNFTTPQEVEIVLADTVGFAPPYFLSIGFVGRTGNFTDSCVSTQLASLQTAIIGRRTGSTSTASSAGAGCNAFVTMANPTSPAPQAFVRTGGTTYVDNVLYPVLAGAPGSTTTISVSLNHTGIVANVSSLTFTTSNWSQPQPIALTLASGASPLPTYNLNVQFTITSPSQTFAIPSYNYPLKYSSTMDGLGCFYPPGCLID